MTKLFKLVH